MTIMKVYEKIRAYINENELDHTTIAKMTGIEQVAFSEILEGKRILNSDDFFTSDNIIETVADNFKKDNIDAFYGDIHFVNPDDLSKTVRYYSSAIFKPSLFRFGFMPAHPSFYMKKECYDKYGLYALDYKIASDYDLLIRYLYKERINYKYLKKDFVTMRTGGVSTENFNSRVTLNREIVRACKKYGIKTNMFLLSFKYLYKIFELRN